MLDRRFIVENVDLVTRNCAARGSKADVARFVTLENERKAKQTALDDLNRQANEVSKSIGQAKDPAEREARKAEGRRLRETSAAAALDFQRLAEEADAILRTIPNLTHPDAPLGGEDASREVRRGSTPLPEFDFKPRDHVQIAERLNLIDFEGVRKLPGTAFTS